jgi:hypothetical protein
MLTLIVGAEDSFTDETQTFVEHGGFELELEHSLVSLSKWESIYEEPFLGEKAKTEEQIASYITCMLLTENPPEDFLNQLSIENYQQINSYIAKKMTATWFSDQKPQTRTEIITSELIYYWMTVFNIPFECETWHLNRLLTLIRICNIKAEKPKNMSRAEAAQRQRELNAQRKAMMKTKG